jgi:inorganic pyrophosphatase/exopolyphosphatase
MDAICASLALAYLLQTEEGKTLFALKEFAANDQLFGIGSIEPYSSQPFRLRFPAMLSILRTMAAEKQYQLCMMLVQDVELSQSWLLISHQMQKVVAGLSQLNGIQIEDTNVMFFNEMISRKSIVKLLPDIQV